MTGQQQTNPMFGRPTWTYVDVIRGPVRGPQPRLAQGTGRTGQPAAPGTAAQLPGYVSDNAYQPSPFTYQPDGQIPFWGMGPHAATSPPGDNKLGSTYSVKGGDNFETNVPRTINTGENGRELVGTYQPHDFTPGQRFFHQMRRASNWQIMAFGPKFRNTIAWQQVQKYRVRSSTVSAQPLGAQNYFLGYQVQPEVQSQLGQNALGYMGSI